MSDPIIALVAAALACGVGVATRKRVDRAAPRAHAVATVVIGVLACVGAAMLHSGATGSLARQFPRRPSAHVLTSRRRIRPSAPSAPLP